MFKVVSKYMEWCQKCVKLCQKYIKWCKTCLKWCQNIWNGVRNV